MDCFPDKNVIGGAPFNVAVHLIKNCGHNIPVEASSIALNFIQKKIL